MILFLEQEEDLFRPFDGLRIRLYRFCPSLLRQTDSSIYVFVRVHVARSKFVSKVVVVARRGFEQMSFEPSYEEFELSPPDRGESV